MPHGADHLAPCLHHVEFLADVLADDLEHGAILGAETALLGQFVHHLDP